MASDSPSAAIATATAGSSGSQSAQQRAAAALDEQRRLAVDQHDVGAGRPRRPAAGPRGPRQRRAVRLSRIGGGQHDRLGLAARLAQVAQPLDGARQRELGAAEALHEVAAAGGPGQLERRQLAVQGAEPAADRLGPHGGSRHHAVALEQDLGPGPGPVGLGRLAEQRRGRQPAAGDGRRRGGRAPAEAAAAGRGLADRRAQRARRPHRARRRRWSPRRPRPAATAWPPPRRRARRWRSRGRRRTRRPAPPAARSCAASSPSGASALTGGPSSGASSRK